jgi:hypothetical protein
LGCGDVSGKAAGWAASVGAAGAVAEVCWIPLSAAGFIGQLVELTGVFVFTAGGTAFLPSTPLAGTSEPALLAGPVGSGAAVPVLYAGVVVVERGWLFQACDDDGLDVCDAV